MSLTDNRTQLNDCQDDNQTFSTTGSALGTNTLAGNTIITPNSVQVQHSNVYDDTYTSGDSAGATFNIDLSDSTVYIPIKDNGYDLANVVGAGIVFGDGTDRIGYSAGGSDALGLPYQKVFNVFKLDGSDAAANPGTADVDHHVFAGVEANLDFTQVTIVGYGGIHNAKAQGNVANVYISGIYYISNASYAASILGGTSGTPETMTDLVGDDETVGAAMFSNPIGDAFYIYAPTEWGDSAGVTTTAFEGTDEQWYYVGDNGGGRAIGVGNFFFRLVGNSTGTNIFRQTRVVNINTGSRAPFDWSDTNFDEIELETTTWVEFGALTCPANDASKFCNNSIFINCDQMITSGMDMDGNTWNGTTDANGAVLWSVTPSDVANQVNSTFVSDGTGHAIEILLNTASLTTYNVSGLTVDGYATQAGTAGNRVFFIDNLLDGDVTINLTDATALNPVGGGTENFSYEVAAGYTGTVTINQTVTLTVTVVDTDNNPIQGVSVRIENQSTGALVSQGTTNASGIYTDATYNYTADLAVTTKARLKGYKNFRTAGTIENTGISVGVTMQNDPAVDLP